MELREEIADLIYRYFDEDYETLTEEECVRASKQLADAILAIPEIRDALELAGMEDLPPLTNEQVRAMLERLRPNVRPS
jgi:hypothetical protein